jgi:Alginate export
MIWRAKRRTTIGAAMLMLSALAGAAQEGGSSGAADSGGGVGGPGSVALPSAVDTLVIDAVQVSGNGTTGDTSADAQVIAQVRAAVGLRAGDRLSSVALEVLQARLGTIPGVARVSVRLDPSGAGGRARLLVDVGLAAADPAAIAPTGMLAGGGTGAFPTIWRSEGRLLRFILNTGVGGFSDGNPWFGSPNTFTLGNPLVQDPAIGADTGDRATWAEGWIEFGVGGVSQIGTTNSAVYGAVTVISPMVTGQDIFRDDFRQSFNIEKAYVGYLWADPDRQRSLDISAGRLNFSLNDGFLISQYVSQWNAGPRPGVYLAPRTALDFGAVGKFKQQAWTATAFYLDPNEYEPFETNTQLAGLNLRYSFSEPFYADVTMIRAVDGDYKYRTPAGVIGTRDGLTTLAAHIRWADRDALPGWWAEAEAAHQTHRDFDMDAYAAYATVGYLARDLPWTPSISFRASTFTGDDPATAAYERFDPLYSGGLSEWLQGISLGKVLTPSNRNSQRIRVNVAPNPRLNLTLDYFWHQADQLNNIGGNPALSQLSSTDLGQELQFTSRWAISDNLYFLGVLARAFPGEAIDDAVGGNAKDWTTVQAQLFWSF